jgi:hypothetical protein
MQTIPGSLIMNLLPFFLLVVGTGKHNRGKCHSGLFNLFSQKNFSFIMVNISSFFISFVK